ncbi:MAG: hypothetical protein PHN92_06240 [Geobacter sp.]|nr:hypothetical protein [Geobacter sp.]
MKNSTSVVSWVQLSHNQQMSTGGCWQERCYPFRGVFSENRAATNIERRRMLDDYWLALQEFNLDYDRPETENAGRQTGEKQ